MTTELKCRKAGNAFPGDYNWECPTCGCENRAFQLGTPEDERGYTRQDLEAACTSCSHRADAAKYPHYSVVMI